MEAAAVKPTLQQEPVFLRENWKALMAHPNSNGYNRVIRVSDGAATITSKAVMLRCPMRIPPGFYLFNERNELVAQNPKPYQGYQDPLGCYQPFERMTPSPKIPAQTVANLIQYLEHVRQRKANVVVDRYGIIPMEKYGLSAATDKREHFGFGHELPLGNDELILDPYNLKLALVEMMRYDGCHIYHWDDPHVETPLVLGYNWDSCALVMSQRE